MQRRDNALSAIEKNPALEAYRPIAENSVIKKELKTLSDTGKALNTFSKLMEDNLISTDSLGRLKYNMTDDFQILSMQILETKVMQNEKTLNSLLPAYAQPGKPEPGTSAASLSLSAKNTLTRT
ncbi:hypothetical protein [Pseudomonas vlassakiae]|nr:hypothetical protein [Pseudomonas vlassakiae]